MRLESDKVKKKRISNGRKKEIIRECKYIGTKQK